VAYGKHVQYDTLREVLSGSIAAAYTNVGSALTHEIRMLIFVNSTDKDLYISIDGATNIMRIAAASTQIQEYCTNRVSEDGFFVPIGTQFSVNRTEGGAPTKGSIAIEAIFSTPM
jgi:hypothetical protein